MLRKMFIYSAVLLLIISSWVIGFYFGRKSETDKKLNLLYSLSHVELLVDSIELIDNSQIGMLREELTKTLDSSLFPVFYEFSIDVNQHNRSHLMRAGKLIKKADQVLLRQDVDYLPELRTDIQSKEAFHSYITKGLAEIRKFNSEEG